MKELSIKEFNDFVVDRLEELKEDGKPEVVLENPNAKGVFPSIVVQSPLVFIERIGILQRFSIVVESWDKKKSNAYMQADKIDKKLREYNFIRTSTPIDFRDDITGCYRYGGSYEVLYNALNNTFEKIKN